MRSKHSATENKNAQSNKNIEIVKSIRKDRIRERILMPKSPELASTQSDVDSSDWDEDDDFLSKKINIKIKPSASKISASVDELRATVETWKPNIKLVKPNSRRHHQSTVQLQVPVAIAVQECLNSNHLNNWSCLKPSALNDTVITNDKSTHQLPVAIAIQECLNANIKNSTADSSSNIIGYVKLAVPPKIITMNPADLEDRLEITLVSSISYDKIKLRDEFVIEINDVKDSIEPFFPSNSTTRLSINMREIQAYVQKQSITQQNAKYYTLPELVKYSISPQNKNRSNSCINPLNVVSHWLCDLSITKVRVDIQLIEDALVELGITTNDIRNLKISMQVNGGVNSYQSKPEASWNLVDSRLTWFFTNMTELVQKSTLNNVTSCLARFDLNDGPTKPSEVTLQFSIVGKTISGSHIILNSTNNHQLAVQKFEVRSGIFKCHPSCL